MTVTMAIDTDWIERYSVASRDVYRRVLAELAAADPRIFCMDSDMGGFEDSFAAHLPEQYVNVGIAEANLLGMSAGLAATGLRPYANTIASFAAARACEQMKIDIAGNDLPVRVVVTHAGLSAGHYGPTHHAVEDIAIVRTLPNMTVVVPCDAAETEYAVRATADLPGPLFLRLGRAATPLVHTQPYEFRLGQAHELRAGDDVTIVATGPYPVVMALAAQRMLTGHGVHARVLNMHTVKPIDRAALVRAARQTRGIVTVEDHVVAGGLGAAVCEVVAEEHPCPVRRIGVPDRFNDFVADEKDLLVEAGVSPERIAEAALAVLRR
ncbi:transketolase C-terminal domain-containing protein [Actinoplanes sp. NEAU-A12]|uniref:Transketolase C-terminal domain-containing protein n=1 Tax=Actinoplanes sandaracinus TaxID=3045177 RepID=A0ABT6WTB5_9ACTN|nr:transketolase C-terminal domain-containing protein [Actinoplanes sandaracinus]MDI6102993.1 transketolase C-terminal domain-containing protein [Actinoplanes sandaracinus]